MPSLTIIVATADAARFQAAVELAAANAALGHRTRLFLQAPAVPLLREHQGPVQLLEEAIVLGASVTACQTGLAAAGMSAMDLPEGVDTGGLIGLLSHLEEDQLLMA